MGPRRRRGIGDRGGWGGAVLAASVVAVLAQNAALSEGGFAPLRPESGDAPRGDRIRPLLSTQQAIPGGTPTDLRFGFVAGACADEVDLTAMIQWTGPSDVAVVRCRGDVDAAGGTICDAPESGILFDLDDPTYGCSSGNCFWNDLRAGSDDGETCDGYSGAAVVGNVFPPANYQVTAFGAGSPPVVVASFGDEVPGASGETFTSFSFADSANGYVVFVGTGSGGRSGVYVFDRGTGNTEAIADTWTQRPRSGDNMTFPTSLDVTTSDVDPYVAWADSGGVYTRRLDSAGPISQVAAVGDSFGGGTLGSTFVEISTSPDTPRSIAFRGVKSGGGSGIFSVRPVAEGVIRRHVDNLTPVPGAGGNFGLCQRPSIAGDTVAFECFNASLQYLGTFADVDPSDDGVVRPLLLRGDVVDLPGLGIRTVQTPGTNSSSVIAPGRIVIVAYYQGGGGSFLLIDQGLLAADHETMDLSQWTSHTD